MSESCHVGMCHDICEKRCCDTECCREYTPQVSSENKARHVWVSHVVSNHDTSHNTYADELCHTCMCDITSLSYLITSHTSLMSYIYESRHIWMCRVGNDDESHVPHLVTSGSLSQSRLYEKPHVPYLITSDSLPLSHLIFHYLCLASQYRVA